MKLIIKFYLLTKSILNRTFTWFDIGLANALLRGHAGREEVKSFHDDYWNVGPAWIRMIANMGQEAALPEAFVDWCIDIEDRIDAFFERGRHAADED